jgi:VanZ family protein
MALFLFLAMPILTKSFLPAVLWFILITILFVLPGSEFPEEDWFHKVYLDKWVHSGFFFLLVYLFAVPLISRGINNSAEWLSRIMLLAIVYGIIIEFIQKWWIPGRSFDVTDMIFDGIGAFAGWLWAKRLMDRYQKK